MTQLGGSGAVSKAGSGGSATPQAGAAIIGGSMTKGGMAFGDSVSALGGADAKGGESLIGGAAGSGDASAKGGAAATNGTAGSAGSGSPSADDNSCLSGIADFYARGPFSSTTKRVGSINYYVPAVPAGCKVPVVHLANGTGASCATYLETLSHLASHGFLATCYESANTGAGTQGLEALDTALSTFPELADRKFGSTGHSQGGQAAFVVLALAQKKYGDEFTYAGLALQPASGFGAQPSGSTWQQLYASLTAPMFMFSGKGSDGLVSQSWVQQAYEATSKSEEAYFWTKNGSTHIPVPNGEAKQIGIPWFRWKLLGDQAACRVFNAITTQDKTWAEVAAKNKTPCQ